MLGKLSGRNAKRQAKDYVIYFITMIISVSLIFSFNSILFSEDINQLSTMMNFFNYMIIGVSVLLVIVIGWLINYTMKFMLEKRSKEFGTYSILGMEKKDISSMFVMENSIIGAIALGIGIFVGTFLYQIFTYIIMNMFNQPYQIKFGLSLGAVILTIGYFLLIFVFALIRNRKKLKKTKVYDLLHADKQNENELLKKGKGTTISFILSIILAVVGLVLLYFNFTKAESVNGIMSLVSAVLLIVSTYLFYISFSSILVKFFINNKERKYKKNNMFLFRNITSKINTMSITMGTLAMLFTFTLIGMNVSVMLNGMMENELNTSFPYDVMISSESSDFSSYINKVEEVGIKSKHEYRVYPIPGDSIYSKVLSNTSFPTESWYDYDQSISLSDYNKLREMLELDKVTLDNNEYTIHCINTAEKYFKEYKKDNITKELAGETLTLKDIKTEAFAQTGINGYMFIFVLPDNMIEKISNAEVLDNKGNLVIDYRCVIKTNEKTTEKMSAQLQDMIPTQLEAYTNSNGEVNHQLRPIDYISTRGARESQTKSSNTMFSFLMFYISLIFVTTSATILAIQQLSDSEKYKYRYQLLDKIGMDKKEKNKLILKQLVIYFLLPMVLPIILTIPTVIFVGNIFTVAITTTQILINLGMTIGIFLLVYCIYLIATYVQFERNINTTRK